MINRKKAISDLDDAIKILETSIQSFRSGQKHMYKVIAVQLRMLLCDGNNTLLPKLFKRIILHPLRHYEPPEKRPDWKKTAVFYFPGLFHGRKGLNVHGLFDPNAKPILLEEWLDQPILNDKLTIKQLIRSVTDKEAVHSDNDYNSVLRFAKEFAIVDDEMHQILITVIAEYVLHKIKEARPLLKE